MLADLKTNFGSRLPEGLFQFAVPCSPAFLPESDNSFLYFSLASIVSRISSSTSFLGRE